MHEHIENLKPGDWITVVDDREEHFDDSFGGEYWQRKPIIPDYPGHPAKVLAVDFPFIVVDAHQINSKAMTRTVRCTIDVRRWRVKKLSAAYVKSFIPDAVVGPKKRKKKEKPDPRLCPNCQQMRRSFLKDGQVELVCEECDKKKTGVKIIVN